MEETKKCDDGFDCYSKNGTYIEDCYDYANERVSCYKLVYRYDLAVGAAGGALALASKSIGFYGSCVPPIWRRYHAKCSLANGSLFLALIPVITKLLGMTLYVILMVTGQLHTTTDSLTFVTYVLLVSFVAYGVAYVVAPDDDESNSSKNEDIKDVAPKDAPQDAPADGPDQPLLDSNDRHTRYSATKT